MMPVDETIIPAENCVPRAHVTNWFKSGALENLVHGALLQGGAYDALVEILAGGLAGGLRMDVVKPHLETPTLNVLQGRSSSPVKVYLTEGREFLKAV
ncbi:hypothetical protein PF005_g21906 [Phytophthora fragariae]|uniref:Oxidoreductase putative C-terminal domain-containing protein n=2 Tax=Phytophthora fragariae TaxID=53985 RepID=A0A6A3X1W5_9STRA|nr:hypothetical protein PF003_g33239 [Phytophthora fragariae]KAE8926646.1 hypothetical protein PF009_g23172 [Phytophthora fragariae]KAE8983414.1 hypothetical protein PF011_g21199 [Phytophthora fragariae]KAE9081409.1 hypothetical protein PF010_g22008 [Phytophthora fragariae]KAE9105338.1 hypothetical protein PF006_g21672 [Phytophthora fragariae]